jgi:hypothetical protein
MWRFSVKRIGHLFQAPRLACGLAMDDIRAPISETELMTKSLLMVAAAALCIAPAAFAADPDQAAAPTATAATAPAVKAKKDSDIICKYQQPVGSRLGGKKVCMSRYDWQQQSNQARDTMSYRTPTPGMNPH